MVNNYQARFNNTYCVYLCQEENITYCITYCSEDNLELLQHIRWRALNCCYKYLYPRCCTIPRSASVDSVLN